MSWNYRIIKKELCNLPNKAEYDCEDNFSIHEVYYDSNGNIECWTEEAITICGETLEELQHDLENYQRAFDLPVLLLEELESQIKN